MFFRKRPILSSVPESAPAPRSTPASSSSVIGQNTRFRGEVRGRGPLRIRGQVKGTVAIDQGLTIENGSSVEADALATDILVAGSIQGNLRARGTLALRSTGRVEGSLQASRMRVEEGAILKGTVLRGGSSS